MRLGVFGGSFDPVHYGHLLLAECCREACALDAVWFVPAASPPHKPAGDLSAADHRVEMLRLTTGGHSAFEVSTLEIERGGTSYTVDTLEEMDKQFPDADLFLLLGADMWADLPNWREPARICELATPIVVCRPPVTEVDLGLLGGLIAPSRREEIARLQTKMPQIDLSSSEIRRRVAAGLSIRYQTPRAVEKYIETHGLYRANAATLR